MHRSILAAPLAALLAASALLAPTAEASPKPPPPKAINSLMQEHYIGDDAVNYPTVRYHLTIDKIQRGASRKGSYRHDGVPPHKTTIVFPTKLTMTYTVCYPDGSARRQKIVAEDVFFKDEYNAWTFRLQNEKRTPPAGSDKLAACPLTA
jgi:hypothetical protein